jgi:hypothetical protein
MLTNREFQSQILDDLDYIDILKEESSKDLIWFRIVSTKPKC